MVRERGLTGLAMRDLGERVGMKAQSIYSYFDSKYEIYDAMFLEGYQAFAEVMADVDSPTVAVADPAGAAKYYAGLFFRFCTSDPVRYQLMFQRTIPGFVPSPDSWAVAVAVYERMITGMAAVGLTDPAWLDLFTAMLTGLTDQQISNDPGGQRWERLLDRAVDMLLREAARSANNHRQAHEEEPMTSTSTTSDALHDPCSGR